MDLTKSDDVMTLMRAADNETQWNRYCDLVKEANGGDYPCFWWGAVVLSGLAAQKQAEWAAKV